MTALVFEKIIKKIPSAMRLGVYAMLGIVIASFTGCSDETPSSEIVLYDVVKLESMTNAGSTFTLSKPLSSEVITLSTTQLIDTSYVHIGDRLLIAYVPANGEAYTSGSISLRGYTTVTNSTLIQTNFFDIFFANWNADPVWLISAWKSENYLNVRVRLPYYTEPRQFVLVRDLSEDTDPACPNLYLVHNLGDSTVNTFDQQYYASFDISSICEDENISGFNLILNNSNLRMDTIAFGK